jgi:hypothetical protein
MISFHLLLASRSTGPLLQEPIDPSTMTSFWRVASKGSLPMAAALVSHATRMTFCDAEPVLEKKSDASSSTDATVGSTKSVPVFTAGMQPDAEGDYYGHFPKRQLWQPKVEYPLWDSNWDGRELPSTGDKEEDRQRTRHIRKTGVTRHVILIRHGQYDETHKVKDGGYFWRSRFFV